jgi:hypothetical protein
MWAANKSIWNNKNLSVTSDAGKSAMHNNTSPSSHIANKLNFAMRTTIFLVTFTLAAPPLPLHPRQNLPG